MAGRVFYYALGGGLGHVTRLHALARRCAAIMPGDHHLLCNSPFLSTIPPSPNVSMSTVGGSTGLSLNAAREMIPAMIREFEPDCLVVDVFPRGLVGELASIIPELSCTKILIGRALPDQYVKRYELTEWVEEFYDTVILTEPSSPFGDVKNTHRTSPLLSIDPSDLLPMSEACNVLRTTIESPVVLVVASGTDEECREWTAIVQHSLTAWPEDLPPLRLVMPEGISVPQLEHFSRDRLVDPLIRYYPIAQVFRAVRLVVGNGGYNLVNETRSMNIPGLFCAQRRKYDDQLSRLSDCDVLSGSVVEAVRAKMEEPFDPVYGFENGLDHVVRVIRHTVAGQGIA